MLQFKRPIENYKNCRFVKKLENKIKKLTGIPQKVNT